MSPRKSAPDAELSRALIDRAAEALTLYGVDGLSLRKVAEAAGTSTMTVYTRFGSKGGLLAAMHREAFRRLGVALTEAASDPDPLAALAETGRAYRRVALHGPDLYALMFGPPVPGLESSAEDLAAAGATYEPLVSGVRRCCEAGVMAGDPDAIALHLWAVVHGMVSLEIAGQLPGHGGRPSSTADGSGRRAGGEGGSSSREGGGAGGEGPIEDVYERALVWAALPFLT